MEKLELKNLAPYLPYGLNCKVELTGSSELPWYFSETGVYKIDGLMLDWMDSDEVESIKPILRPLSDLKTFNVIDVDQVVEYRFNTVHFVQLNLYWQVELLFKHHFDVFGLIEKGLAIDINTLEK